jgi:flagellar biosynthesis/type III secretory pathway chaperone
LSTTSGASILEKEVEQLARLRELLDSEKTSLERFDSEGLLRVAAEKARIASVLRDLSARRQTGSDSGGETGLPTKPPAQELLKRRNLLLREIWERCETLRLALDEQARMVGRLLSFLKGLRLGSCLYDSRGRISAP